MRRDRRRRLVVCRIGTRDCDRGDHGPFAVAPTPYDAADVVVIDPYYPNPAYRPGIGGLAIRAKASVSGIG